jgi:hypothetical protein
MPNRGRTQERADESGKSARQAEWLKAKVEDSINLERALRSKNPVEEILMILIRSKGHCLQKVTDS